MRILFIGIGFYSYEKAIKQEIENNGHTVFYFSSAPESTTINGIKRRLHKNFFDSKIWERILKSPSKNDVVFVIKGENLTESHISLLKKKNPNAKFILYLWDCLKKIGNKEILFDNFERILSFDRIDCEHNKRIEFRPLFYRNSVPCGIKSYTGTAKYDYQISFVGWLHSDRLNVLNNILLKIDNSKSKFFYLYTSIINKIEIIMNKNFSKELKKCVHTKTLPYNRYISISNASQGILDISETDQSGLTMRSIEALALGKILYTTNKDIINYSMISENSYVVVDRKNFFELKNITNPIIQSQQFYKYFSLSEFVNDILS